MTDLDVQNIRSSVTMRDLAAMYGYEVNRSGMMRCCFHGEDKHPSLKVYDGDRGWWCFVCNEGGDIFDFVMKHDGLEFPKAVERIAEMAGIPISNGRSGLSDEDRARIQQRKAEREEKARAKEERQQRMNVLSDRIRILESIKDRCEPLSYVWCGADRNIFKLQREWDYLFNIQD